MENALSMWEMVEIRRNRLKYVSNDLDISEMSQIFGKIFKYLRKYIDVWKAA